MAWFVERKRKWWALGVLVLVTAWGAWYVSPANSHPFRLGLDLKGGTHLVYAADTSELHVRDERGAMEGVRDVIERRVNALGVAEPVVQLTEVDGQWRLIVELAGVYDTERAMESIGATPVLDFRERRAEVAELTPEQQGELTLKNQDAKARAQEVLQAAQQDDVDFEALAKEYSEDIGSAMNGGDLGWFKRGAMVESFDEAVFDQLETDEITSKLVETEFGWHVIKKTGERDVPAGSINGASVSAVGESGQPAAVDIQVLNPEQGSDEQITEVRASHILIRKTKPADLLGLDAAWKRTELGGTQLKQAFLQFDQTIGQPEVALEFDDAGAKLLEEISERNIGQPLAIFIDGYAPIDVSGDGVIDEQDVYAPIINDKIMGGSAVITGNMTVERAKTLASRLQAGALPVPISVISQTTVGPTLGAASVAASIRAAIIGFFVVALFMIVYYRLPGVASVLALGVYGVLVLAVLKLLHATMTLAGIAGFVMSIGMAVDANVLVLERLREELERGRSLLDAIATAFKRAWTSIRDANGTTLITSIILATFSTSVVKGFAVTLAIGVIVSLFSAMVVTRTFLYILAGKGQQRGSLYGVKQVS
ncbi:MAG: protein translocase subunit SecD [Candidatus Uhrbacteria bacterium]